MIYVAEKLFALLGVCVFVIALAGALGIGNFILIYSPDKHTCTKYEGAHSAGGEKGMNQLIKAKHPWLAFLEARAAVIDWKWPDQSCEEIAKDLSMDAQQVAMVRMRDRLLDTLEKPRRAEARCLDCGGTGSRDGGGVRPLGEAIYVPCDCGTDAKT